MSFNHFALKCSSLLCSVAVVLATPAYGQEKSPSYDHLADLSLEQLSSISVTSVSKREEKASEAAAAIFVITQEDIRRSGMNSIPEVLRMVPGLNVAQIGSHQWAISARGFNGTFSNKLLVLMDGRSVYTPLFSGVYWDAQDTVIEDIDRIEVIRGPGATLWGANAVNGVINIITKKAQDTQGGYASFTAGNQDRALMATRYGAKLGDAGYVRAYAKYDERDEVRTLTRDGAHDEWNKSQAGFRADWDKDEEHSFTFQGDIYSAGASGQLSLPTLSSPFSNNVKDRESIRGGNILGRWNYTQSRESDMTLQLYYDNAQRENLALKDDDRHTLDVDFQHAWQPHERHEIVWGIGYRLVSDEIAPSANIALSPRGRTDRLYSAFVQDKIALSPEEFFVTLGSKFEHNDYTGFELQPSARFSWLIDDEQMAWASVARAVRTPGRFVDDGRLASSTLTGVPAFVGTVGNDNLDSEIMRAYEIGYRIQPMQTLSFDAAAFYNNYNRLIIGSLGSLTTFNSPVLGTIFYVPITPVNLNNAHSTGFELSTKWNVTPDIDLVSGYTFLDLNLYRPDTYGFDYRDKSPKHQFNLSSTWRLPHDLEASGSLYYVDNLKGATVDAYTRLDLRLAWRPIEQLELSLVGQNLLDPYHQEFSPYTYQSAAQIPSAYYGNISWKF